MIEETGLIKQSELAALARKTNQPSILRQRMDSLAVGHGLIIKNEADMLKEKRRAQSVANNLNPLGKRFSIRWGNDAKTEFRIVRLE